MNEHFWVFSERLRICMSSSMHRRSAVIGGPLCKVLSLHMQPGYLCKGAQREMMRVKTQRSIDRSKGRTHAYRQAVSSIPGPTALDKARASDDSSGSEVISHEV